MNEVAFQDRYPDLHCYGCGPDNPEGLRIKSYWRGEGEAVCHHTAGVNFCAGPKHFVYGGLIASLIDCHSICTASAQAYREAGREIGEGEPIYFATGRLDVQYLRPVPIEEEMEVVARVTDSSEKKITLEATLSAGGKVCATANVVAVRVPASWSAPR